MPKFEWERQEVDNAQFPNVMSVEELTVNGNRSGEVYSEHFDESRYIQWMWVRYMSPVGSTLCSSEEEAKEALVRDCI